MNGGHDYIGSFTVWSSYFSFMDFLLPIIQPLPIHPSIQTTFQEIIDNKKKRFPLINAEMQKKATKYIFSGEVVFTRAESI